MSWGEGTQGKFAQVEMGLPNEGSDDRKKGERVGELGKKRKKVGEGLKDLATGKGCG